MTEPFAENEEFLDAWRADEERQREEFFLSDRVRVEPVKLSWIPEAILLSALVVVLMVGAYFALKGT